MSNLNIFKKNADYLLLGLVLLLAIFSITMIGSTHISTGFFARDTIVQSGAYVIGFLAVVIINMFHYSALKEQRRILYIVSIIFLFTVYIPFLGVEQFGSRAWINLGITTIQPSELVKILFVFIMASYFEEHRHDLYNFKGLLKAIIMAGPIIVIVLKEDLGSALVFCSIWLSMIFYVGVDLKALGKFFALFFLSIPLAYVFMAPYQKERIEAFLHPENLDLAGNYQVWQGKVAIGSGGFWGKGLFNGTQKELDFIPVQTSDFIFSVTIEELGFLGGIVLLAIFMMLLFRCTRILRFSQDIYGGLIVAGFIGMFLFQIFENIAMNMGIMPVTGITLPFLSYGGSSVLSSMIAIGIILNVGVHNKGIKF